MCFELSEVTITGMFFSSYSEQWRRLGATNTSPHWAGECIRVSLNFKWTNRQKPKLINLQNTKKENHTIRSLSHHFIGIVQVCRN